MPKLTKKVLLPMVALALAVATGTMVVKNVSANEAPQDFSWLSQALADRFNLDPSEVESVIKEQRLAHQRERRQAREANLDRAVSEGKITQEQKDLLLERMSDNHNHRREMRDLFPERRWGRLGDK